MISKKPKLLILRPPLELVSSHFRDAGFLNREKGIKAFFDVSLIEENFDLKILISQYQPDLILFVNYPSCHKNLFQVKNIDFADGILKAGLTVEDSFSPVRWNSIYTLMNLKVDAFFTNDTSFANYYPAIKDQLYHWHEFFDPAVFKNYESEKKWDVLLCGSFKSLNYPWRRKILPLIKEHFNYHELIHWDRDNSDSERKSVIKEEFSKVINAARIVPACGGYNKIWIGKMMEIPASFACLVTEESETMKSMGFVDGYNCVFADETNFVEKVKYLLSNPDLLYQITKNGYDHVRENHIAENRSEIYDWYCLAKQIGNDEKIIQTSLCKGLEITKKTNTQVNFHIYDAVPPLICKQGDLLLFEDKLQEAELIYQKLLQFDSYAANTCIRLSLLYLFKGKFKVAIRTFHKLLEVELGMAKGECIDPVELFVLLLILIIQGKYSFANKILLANYVDDSLHLDFIAFLIDVATNQPLRVSYRDICQKKYQFKSSHEFLNKNSDGILSFIKLLLKRTGKVSLLKSIEKRVQEQNSMREIRREDNSHIWRLVDEFVFKMTFMEKIDFYKKRLFKRNYLLNN